jgi:hypothetical protein
MGHTMNSQCRACGNTFTVDHGGGFYFHLLRCDKCGQTKSIGFNGDRRGRDHSHVRLKTRPNQRPEGIGCHCASRELLASSLYRSSRYKLPPNNRTPFQTAYSKLRATLSSPQFNYASLVQYRWSLPGRHSLYAFPNTPLTQLGAINCSTQLFRHPRTPTNW